jgi:hypothetical protein
MAMATSVTLMPASAVAAPINRRHQQTQLNDDPLHIAGKYLMIFAGVDSLSFLYLMRGSGAPALFARNSLLAPSRIV